MNICMTDDRRTQRVSDGRAYGFRCVSPCGPRCERHAASYADHTSPGTGQARCPEPAEPGTAPYAEPGPPCRSTRTIVTPLPPVQVRAEVGEGVVEVVRHGG